MQCPVTLHKFIDPRVLPCGHTVDRKALDQLTSSECPLCRTSYKTFRPLPVNWAVAEYLGLNIPPSPKPTTPFEIARENRRRNVEIYVTRNMPFILDRISSRSLNGFSDCKVYLCDLHIPYDRTRVLNSIMSELGEMGFSTRLGRTNCLCVLDWYYCEVSW
jgi:hypothetical protein